MKTSTKLGIVGIAAGLVVQIGVSIWEINDYRKGKRRMAKHDIELIASEVVKKQEQLKLEKKKVKTSTKEA